MRLKSAKNGKSGQKLGKIAQSNFSDFGNSKILSPPHDEIVITSKKMLQIGSEFARTFSNKIGSHTSLQTGKHANNVLKPAQTCAYMRKPAQIR